MRVFGPAIHLNACSCNVTSCASVQAFIPPSTVRFAPVMYEDSGPATNATAAADAAGGAGDESRFPESVLITWVPDDWTLTPGPSLPWLSQQNSLSKMMEGNGSRSEDCRS